MSTPHPLDVQTTPLAGLNLIEASAGTGKTWTIGGLYCRLVVEAGLHVGQILVVTYTKAATAELRERIRARLAEMLAALEGEPADEFCAALIERLPTDQHDIAARRLRYAVSGFDEAAIYTIHGFCQRALADHAFAAGVDFDREFQADDTGLIGQVVDDTWRRETAQASRLWAAYLLHKKQTPDVWAREFKTHFGKPFLRHLRPMPWQPESESAYLDTWAVALQTWQQEAESARQVLQQAIQDKVLNGRSYSAERLTNWFAQLQLLFQSGKPQLALPEKMINLAQSVLRQKTNKGQQTPEHPMFEAIERLLAANKTLHQQLDYRLGALKARLMPECEQVLRQLKAQQRSIGYQDLLVELASALDGANGAMLAQHLGQRYQAALIDEFQDTDPLQYRIFERIYGSGERPAFLVGDPKQAIYAFRGADIHAYLAARHATSQQYTLGINRRSTAALIASVNQLFTRPLPFLLEGLEFHPVAPAPAERPPLRLYADPHPDAALIWHWMGNQPLTKTKGQDLAAEACARDIARLLHHGGQIGDTPLNGGDIAVLVANHRQARQLANALALRGVPCVRQGQDNVFGSEEAEELERLLAAFAEPTRETLVRAALVGTGMGLHGSELYRLGDDTQAWEAILDDFQRYHLLWREHGLITAFRAWFDQHRVAERLLSYRDGERRLTNLLHLAELAQVESRRKHDLDSLVAWFEQCRRNPPAGLDAHQLRLESDAARVKIVTIHTSKGLEYPVVYCPFLWDGIKLDKTIPVACHSGDTAVLDWGSDQIEQHRQQSRQEQLAEKLRLLYVALTRARYRCIVTWGAVSEVERSAMAWLLHGEASADEPLQGLSERLKAIGPAGMLDVLQQHLDASAGRMALAALPEQEITLPALPDHADRLQARQLSRPLFSDWRMSSFTALTEGRHDESPDHERQEPSPPVPASGYGIAQFPAGARTGTTWHTIFEKIDFTRRDGQLQAVVEAELKKERFDDVWLPAVIDMIETTLATPLDASGVRLADVSPRQKLVELEFTFATGRIRPGALAQLLAVHGERPEFIAAAQDLTAEIGQGFMKGFIDLAFEAGGRYYVLDYKSNRLGHSTADYTEDRLVRAMADSHYYLQSLLYVVALCRYLRTRITDFDYDRHFGGSFYLFLRGMDRHQPGQGVFADRPKRALIEAMSQLLSGEGNAC